MDLIEVFVLALVQALTEFLPVSSSGHLILVPAFLGWETGGLAFDVALHVGTLIAVVAYFRKDGGAMFGAWIGSITRRRATDDDTRLAWGLVIATVPAAVVGLTLHGLIESYLRGPETVAFQLAVFGIALWLADRYSRSDREVGSLRPWHFLLLGLAQSLALIPGTSRSGITMTAARLLGLAREQAARISFLMAIPVIGLAGGYETLKWLQEPGGVPASDLLIGMAVAAVSGYLCIHWFMKLIGRIGFGIFAGYRVALAALILVTLI